MPDDLKVNEVRINGETVLTTRGDTVSTANLVKNETATNRAGEKIRGNLDPASSNDAYLISDPIEEIADNDYIPFNDVSDTESPKKKTLFSAIKAKFGKHTYQEGNIIPANADVNTYTTEGVYDTAGNSSTISNLPHDYLSSTFEGKLIVTVTKTGNSNSIKQIFSNFYRFKSGNSWTDWSQYALSDNTYQLDHSNYVKRISANDDLNDDDYLIPGTYLCTSIATAQSLSHCPVDCYFKMEVDQGDRVIRQIITVSGDGDTLSDNSIWVRTWTEGVQYHVFSEWECIGYKNASFTYNKAVALDQTNDLDNVKQHGTYYWISSSVPSNAPEQADAFMYVLYTGRDNGQPLDKQIVLNSSENKMFQRTYNGTAWSSWSISASTDDIILTNQLYNSSSLASLDDLPVNTSGLVRFADSIAPIDGITFLYLCYGGSDKKTIELTRFSHSDKDSEERWYNAYNGTSWTGWMPLSRTGTYIGTCTTAGNSRNKEATVADDFSLKTGVRVAIKFSNSNSFSSSTSNPVTLNVNGTGAKNIYYNQADSGSGNTGTNTKIYGVANRYIFYIYDGTYWVWDSHSCEDDTVNPKNLGFGYLACETAAATTSKVITDSSYTLRSNGFILVLFKYSVPADATLNINNTGAKNIRYRGRNIRASEIVDGDRVLLLYTGSNFDMISNDRWGTSI